MKKFFIISLLYIFFIQLSVFCDIGEIVTSVNIETDIHELYKQAEDYYKNGKIGLAEISLKNIIDIDPRFIEAYYFLGKIYRENNDFEKAMFYFERAVIVRNDILQNEKNLKELEENPDLGSKIKDVISSEQEAELLCNQALIYIEDGNFFEAENSLKYAIEKNPNISEYYYRLSDVYMDRGFPALAAIEIKKGLKIKPDMKRYKMIAKLLSDAGEYEEAVRILKKGSEDFAEYRPYLRDMIVEISKFIKTKSLFVIIKRNGKEVIINSGFRDGLKKGMEFRSHLTLYRGGSEVKDLESGELLGWTDEIVVGEILITKVDEKLTYGQITIENDNKIRIGDYVKGL
ncbi:MAG: tetratricopeptide repeat protein [Candidatus Muirbacterium halophilum]|nr:tetratricopeptide repeat protein [Candidatus Muirbacterium halophilum]MCK9474395.1 tetratricopeptide repeat protein [Candidatus Muirbacterium halophilum]